MYLTVGFDSYDTVPIMNNNKKYRIDSTSNK